MNRLIEFLKSVPVTITISLLALIAFVITGAQAAFEFTFESFRWWELHRLFGCHLLHWSTEHLFWDVAMFAILGGMCERKNRRAFLLTLGLSAFAIPLIAKVVSPEALSYRGLSGVDTALFTALAVLMLVDQIRQREWQAAGIIIALSIGLVAKVTMEFTSGSAVFVDTSHFTPLPVAHVVGALIGVIVAAIQLRPRGHRRKKSRVVYRSMTERLANHS